MRYFWIILVFAILSGSVLTVHGQSSNHYNNRSQAYYQEIEKEYRDELKQILSQKGLENSGVTLTKVYGENGTREYTILIHHKLLKYLTKEEMEQLIGELNRIPFSAAGCTFYYHFSDR